ncbi:MAG: FAD-dependent oxidoreductase [Bacteroidota bacterium]
MRIAVIGGLASGPAAAAEAARQDGAEVVLFEAGPDVSVGACEIPYAVAGRLGGMESLIVNTPEELERTRGFRVFTRHRVDRIEPRAGRLTVTSLAHRATREEAFDRFILATGARARRLGVEGEDAPGLFSLRDAADARALTMWLRTEPVRHVVVVGGGYVGFEIAEAMRDRGLRATILDPAGRVLASTLDAEVSGLLTEAVRLGGVTVRAERPTEVLTEADGRVRAVRTDRGELVGCQAVVVAVGVEPRTALAEAAGVALGPTGAVATDREMRTTVRGVWACGDVAETFRVIDGAPVHLPLAPIGRRTARVAARNAARRRGTADTFQGVTPSAAVKAFGVEAASVGLTEAQAHEAGFDALAVQIRHTTRTALFPGSAPIDVRLVVDRERGRLLGGQLVSREGAALRADVLVPLIRAQATARELAEDLDLVYNPPVAPAVDPLIVAASAALRAMAA